MKKWLGAIALLICMVALGLWKVFQTLDLNKFHHLQPSPGETTPASDDLRVSFMGTSSFYISDGVTNLLVEGFCTRPTLAELTSPIASDAKKVDKCIDRLDMRSLDGVFVTHSHYDHSLDAPVFAKRFKAPLFGSESMAAISRGYGLDEALIRTVEGVASFRFGAFEVTFIPSRHSAPLSFLPKNNDQVVRQPLVPPQGVMEFKMGKVFSLFFRHPKGRFIIHPSDGYAPGIFKGFEADVVFLGIASVGNHPKSFRDAYYSHIVDEVRPHTVVPIHWDNFMAPFDGSLRPFPNTFTSLDVGLPYLIELNKSYGRRTVVLPLWQTWTPQKNRR